MAAELLKIHPLNPEQRKIHHVIEVLTKGGIIVYPTDTIYGLGCNLMNKKAIERGINKVNIDTDLRLKWTATLRKLMKEKPGEFDPRKFLGPARDAVKDIIKEKMKLLGSAGKA